MMPMPKKMKIIIIIINEAWLVSKPACNNDAKAEENQKNNQNKQSLARGEAGLQQRHQCRKKSKKKRSLASGEAGLQQR
jgi:hypothetical protein